MYYALKEVFQNDVSDQVYIRETNYSHDCVLSQPDLNQPENLRCRRFGYRTFYLRLLFPYYELLQAVQK